MRDNKKAVLAEVRAEEKADISEILLNIMTAKEAQKETLFLNEDDGMTEYDAYLEELKWSECEAQAEVNPESPLCLYDEA
jgi:hypothetical protein